MLFSACCCPTTSGNDKTPENADAPTSPFYLILVSWSHIIAAVCQNLGIASGSPLRGFDLCLRNAPLMKVYKRKSIWTVQSFNYLRLAFHHFH